MDARVVYGCRADNGDFFASFLRLYEARRRDVALAVQQGQARISETERAAAEDRGDVCGGVKNYFHSSSRPFAIVPAK